MSGFKLPKHEIPSPFTAAAAVPDRLVHLIPDQLAEVEPNHPLFAYARTNLPQDGFEEISARRFANAINRTSWYLESLLGKTPGGFPTIAYIGSSDLRYFLLMFGAIKAGYKMLYLSPRNSLAGHLNVLEKVNCHIFLTAKNTSIEHILSERKMRTAEIPELDELVSEESVPHYPYNKSFSEARSDPCLVLHTTGSTGLPKPIVWKNEILSTYEAWRTIPSIDDYVPMTEVYQEARRAYNAMPLFHTSGLNIGITLSLVLGITTVFGSASTIPHAAYTNAIHKYGDVDASIGPPSMYEELTHDESSLNRLKDLRYILVCGAPLSQAAGNAISSKTRVISNFGATETAVLQRLAPAPEDWSYFYWHPTHSGVDMRIHSEGLFELFLVKQAGLELYQGIFSTFPEIEEYSMNDVYLRHSDPAKPFLYRWIGRVDDVIVLSNGEKIAPALMEASLNNSPLVKGAMVTGHGEFQPAALLDLVVAKPESRAETNKLLQQLLPAIEEANKHAPAHGQLDPYHILFVDKARPINYLGQGKIQRRNTYKLYEEDFKQLYVSAESLDGQIEFTSSEIAELPAVEFDNFASVKQWISGLIASITSVEALSDDSIFFESGVDSLHVIKIVREMKMRARSSGIKLLAGDAINNQVIYTNPTLSQLSAFVFAAAGNKPDFADSAYATDQSDDENHNVKTSSMEALLDRYVQTLSTKDEKERSFTTPNKQTVILTGSTGSLGSYLLDQLVKTVYVERVICIDRSKTAAGKYRKRLNERGSSITQNLAEVEFYQADLSEAQMGLDKEVYTRLLGIATHVLHCQWPVNFNWNLLSFQRAIAGTRNLANFASASTYNAFVLFVSSVAAIGGWQSSLAVPEAPIHDMAVASETGYGQSKLIAECLIDRATEISGIRSAICRVGIVAGPVDQQQGLWNKHEYVPSIVVSSANLSVFPENFPSRDAIDWIPVDKLSKILVEVLQSASENVGPARSKGRAKIFHVVNPRVKSWRADFAAMLEQAYPANSVRPVPYQKWVEALHASIAEGEREGSIDVERIPAIRLVEFYSSLKETGDKGRRGLSTTSTEQASKTLRELEPINQEWLNNWMEQWGIKPVPKVKFLRLL